MRFRFSPWMMSVIQGIYYIAIGLWPLVSMNTFLSVAGPKTDLWLLRTISMLISVIGFSLLLSARTGRLNASVLALALGSAAVLGWADAYYSLTGIIWPIYLLDGVAEAVLIVGWCVAYFLSRRSLS